MYGATMFLDRARAGKVLKQELAGKEKIESAAVALQGDESWNHETIYQNGKFVKRNDWKCYPLSHWATPILVIYYTDGKQKRVPVFFRASDSPKRALAIVDGQVKESKRVTAWAKKTLKKANAKKK